MKKGEIDLFSFTDEWGPEKIVEVYDSKTGMKGFTVIDNTVLGPAKGGIRMTPGVNVSEVFRLARTMTWKNSLAGLPFGGGKSGIIWDKKARKEDFVRAFARSLKNLSPKEYVAAPDVNTSEKEMQIYVEENGNFQSATGKPLAYCKKRVGREVCGLPHELGSTGNGVAHATEVVLKHKKIPIEEARIAIEGFGNVGTFTFKKLEEMGAKIVAVSDSKGALWNPEGLSYKEVLAVKRKKGSVIYGKGKKISGKKLFELEVDVLIPAALPDVINKSNMNKVKAGIIVEAANIPIPLDVEAKLARKKVIVPDFVANAGGVISSYAEYVGKKEDYMQKLVRNKLHKNVNSVLKAAFRKGISPRDAGMMIARARIRKAMKKRR